MSKSESFARHQASVEHVNVGQLIDGKVSRDAIHIAVAPVWAGEALKPGQKVVVIGGRAHAADAGNGKPDGIVDPFLNREKVYRGDQFWLFLMPGTITGLRHVWSHPSFPDEPEKAEGRQVFVTEDSSDDYEPCAC